MRKKRKTTIGYEVKKDSDVEVFMREAYCAAVVEILNGWGIDRDSAERLYGALVVLEQFSLLQEKVNKVK